MNVCESKLTLLGVVQGVGKSQLIKFAGKIASRYAIQYPTATFRTDFLVDRFIKRALIHSPALQLCTE
jgi:2-phosphoglycerate kinase